MGINFEVAGEEARQEAPLQLKFGPSAWFAVEQERLLDECRCRTGLFTSVRAVPDKGSPAVRVTLAEVVAGLATDDLRLHDELTAFVTGAC